jgi:D-tyrosyl-tRNA(Tyr) deacylase
VRVLIQRVTRANVRVSDNLEGEIGLGLVALVGIGRDDSFGQADYLAEKLVNLRIFADDEGRMNRSCLEVHGGILLVSQFTLYGDCRKGRRPGFDLAARPEEAKVLYEYFVDKVKESGLSVATGVFQAHMQVELVNDGPVTFLLET